MFEENENNYPVKPEYVADLSGRNRIMFLITIVAIFLMSGEFIRESYIILLELLGVFFIHELGHYLMMRFFGVKAQGMFLMSVFGDRSNKMEHSTSQKQQAMINLMGPIPGIIAGVILFWFAAKSEAPTIIAIEVSLLLILVNVLNMLPLDPFDGGRIMEVFFFYRNDQHKMIFTLVSSLVLIGAGIILWFWPLTIFGFLMGLKVRGFQKSKEVHDELEESDVNYKKEYKDLTNKEYWKIRAAFLVQNPKLKDVIPSGYTLWENENFIVERVRQILRINIKPDLGFESKILVLILMVSTVVFPLWLIITNIEIVYWYFENASF
ncbi:MAG: site-2 protease family protein [Crocinitomicaceae bacterium]